MTAECKRQVAQAIIDNGFYLRISPTLFYDVLADRLYAKRPKSGDWEQVQIAFTRRLPKSK